MKASRIVFALIAIGVLVFAGVSCKKNKKIYKDRQDFKGYVWNRIEDGKDVSFEKIKIPNIEDTYDIYVSIRHAPMINVDEVDFILKVISPSGIAKQSIHTIKLKDRAGEKFVGDRMGDLIDIKEIVKQYMYFPEKGEYTIVISNYSSKYQIGGIMSIGIEVEKSNLDYDVEKRK